MKKRQITYALPALMLATSLVGCMVENDKTAGGPAGSPPANTKATVTVGNLSDQTYARGILVDKNGNAIASQEINCKAKDTQCKIYVPTELNQPVTLILQNPQGQMVGAFEAKAGQATSETLFPSTASTGIYLTDQLEKKYLSKEGITINQAHERLRTFFQDNPGTGAVDLNVLIANYVTLQRAANPGLSDAQILEALAKRLKDGEIAKPAQFILQNKQSALEIPLTNKDKLAGAFKDLIQGKIEVMSSAHAQEKCSEGLSTFLSVTSNFGDIFPIVGGVVSGLAGIGQEACDDTSDKLDKLSSQMQALAQSVDKVGANLKDAKALDEAGWINSQTEAFKKGRDLVVQRKKSYNDFLDQNLLPNRVRAGSLEEWFKANGGWEAGLNKNNARAALMPILKSMNDIIKDTTTITEDDKINTFLKALDNKCKKASLAAFDKDDNFIASRQQCNNAIFTSAAYVVSYREALPMAKDIFTVLAKYNKENEAVYNEVRFPEVAPDLARDHGIKFNSYDTAYEVTKKTFDAQQAEFKKDLTTKVGHPVPGSTTGETLGYFNAFEGLPPELLTGLTKVQCNQVNSPNSPNIIGWFSPTGVDNDRYIVTQCRLRNRLNMPSIKSKYYYEAVKSSGGNTPINMMGVPMASDYLNEYSGYGKETFGESISNAKLLMLVPRSGDWGAEPNTFNFSVSPPFRRATAPNVYEPFLPLGSESNQTIKEQQNNYAGNLNLIRFQRTVGNIGARNEDFVRYTNAAGFSYIWKMITIKEAKVSKDTVAMRCVSADCSVTDHDQRLSFKDGPQSIWFLQPYKNTSDMYNFRIDGKNTAD